MSPNTHFNPSRHIYTSVNGLLDARQLAARTDSLLRTITRMRADVQLARTWRLPGNQVTRRSPRPSRLPVSDIEHFVVCGITPKCRYTLAKPHDAARARAGARISLGTSRLGERNDLNRQEQRRDIEFSPQLWVWHLQLPFGLFLALGWQMYIEFVRSHARCRHINCK
jgi:hypothetical protein